MIRAVYQFHVYCHVRRVLKRLQVPLPNETSFIAADNPYTSSDFFKICEEFGVPMKYQDEKFYWTYQCGVGWPNDYLGPDSMTHWIIEKSAVHKLGLRTTGLVRVTRPISFAKPSGEEPST